MPLANYLKITIGDQEVNVKDPAELPVSIDYMLEDPDNFQKKRASESLSLRIPATLMNDRLANTFHNSNVMDLTNGNVFRSNQRCVIEANGHELLVGKAFLTSASHTDKPQEYEYNIFGDNADWQVDLQEKTLFDFLQHINFVFSKANIIASWTYDGTSEALPYVFAPVRFRSPFNDNMPATYMRPSLSMYWLLYWGFKSVGYKVQSAFFNTAYFRRIVMPWTWGNFLDSDGTRLNAHRFLAKSVADVYYSGSNGRNDFIWDLNVSNDSTNGAFDNNDDYSYDGVGRSMIWKYKTPHYGILDATFSMAVQVDARLNGSTSDLTLEVFWYRNGAHVHTEQLVSLNGTLAGGNSDMDLKEVFFTTQVNPADNGGTGTVVSARMHLTMYTAKLGFTSITANVLQFQLDYFRIPLGGTIDFQNYTGLKKYRFLDFLRGVIDLFNLSINTDSISKRVVLEPTHPYSLTNDLTVTNGGYFKHDFIDWNGKEDFSKEWRMDNYSEYEREVIFRFKEDTNDGMLKVVQDRNINILAAGKYVFPARFKSGKKEVDNRFFSAVMHYEHDEWKGITGVSPQLIAMVPENLSNASNSESSNTFQPKVAYYKGNVAGAGGWRFDGTNYNTIPFLFAVNYKDGGQNDPILSYSDERIKSGAGYTLGVGMLKRFYWQRLAIMRNGQWYNCWFRLKNIDVAGQLHREYKSYNGNRWELIMIKDYKPLQDGSTACLMRKWEPLAQTDFDNTYPSQNNVVNGAAPVNSFDIKYAQLKCLITDLPT